MKVNIQDLVVLITGAGRGIGEATAYAFAKEGCRLALMSLDSVELEQVAERCKQLGAQTLAIPQDLRNLEALPSMVKRITEELGGLNILVNNAATYYYGPIDKADIAHWDEMLDVNLRSAMRLTQLCIPQIAYGARNEDRGAVIFVSSLASLQTFQGGAGYCASKRGLDGFAEALFEDVGEHGIKVCVIHPGWVNTQMVDWTHLDRKMMIQPDEVAELVRMVATWPDVSCPREIHISAQRKPRKVV